MVMERDLKRLYINTTTTRINGIHAALSSTLYMRSCDEHLACIADPSHSFVRNHALALYPKTTQSWKRIVAQEKSEVHVLNC